MINVKTLGAAGTGSVDDSSWVAAAIATGETVFFPKGTYAINVTITQDIIFEGEGSTASIIKPWDDTKPAVIYNRQTVGWTYHSEIRNLGFQSKTAKTGVGFTFAKMNPAGYAANDELAHNVKFFGCEFRGFDKGVQFPFGNIGTEFYSCGFHSNKYGVYSLNNKFGTAMHAGNKYFYAGEFSGNECAVYVHNTQDGFGGLSFKDVIFEANPIAAYIYTNNVVMPVSFDGCWNEVNGVSSGTASVTLDQWSGSSKTTTSFGAHAFIFDGASSVYSMDNMFFSDVYLKATNSKVTASNCRAEYTAGVGGAPCIVDDALSQIVLVDPTTDYGVPRSARVFTHGAVTNWKYTIDANSAAASARISLVPHRFSKQEGYTGAGPGTNLKLTTSTPVGSGSFSAIGGSVVADGVLFPACNEWTIPFTAGSQFMRLEGSTVTTTAGWYVATVDLKVTNGTPNFYIWDRNTAQFAAGFAAPTNNQWHTLCALGYSAGGQTVYFDIGGTTSAVTFRASAWQMRRFDTMQEAQQFVRSMAYVEPSLVGSATYDPPSLAAGASTTTTVACAGAALGDFASASFSVDLQGVTMAAWVSAANTVSVRFRNDSGATLDLASGTLRATVMKP